MINGTSNPSTSSAICYERTSANGANVGIVAGANVQVNGVAVTADGNVKPWPAKRYGGYCFQSSKAFGWLAIF